MKIKFISLSLLMFVFFDSMAFQEQVVIKDELIISFAQTANINSSKNATGKRTITTSNSSLDKLLKNSNISKIELAYPRVSELKPSKYKDQLLRTYRVKYDNIKLNELGTKLKKINKEIEFVDVISVESLFHTPNDYYPLWDYWVNYDYSMDLIKAEQAWDITKGSSNVKIAVIDTDFDLTHEEFSI